MRKGLLIGSILVLAFVRSLSFGQELRMSVTPFKGNTVRTRVFVPNEDKIGPIYLEAKKLEFAYKAGELILATEKATLVFGRFKETYTITRTQFGDYKFPDETNPPFIEYVAGSGGPSINVKESEAKVVKVIVTSDGGILRGRNQRIELKAANNIMLRPITACQSKRTVVVNGTMKKIRLFLDDKIFHAGPRGNFV